MYLKDIPETEIIIILTAISKLKKITALIRNIVDVSFLHVFRTFEGM